MSGEEGGSIRRGEDAGLFNLRAILSNNSNNGTNSEDANVNNNNSTTREAAFTQFLDASKEERIIHNLLAVQASLTGSDDDDSHANVDGEATEASTAAIVDFTNIAGYTAVTSEQIIFVARDNANAAHDLAIDAACIDLHAVQQEPVISVYLQITNPDAVDEEASPLELTLEAVKDDDTDKDDSNDDGDNLDTQSVSQTLFDALSSLVELHPVDPNDDMMDMGGGSGMGGGGQGFGVMAGMGMGMGEGEWMGADGIMDDSDVDDLMVVRGAAANGSNNSNSNNGGEHNDAHHVMLDRLDNMLEVPDDLVVADEDNNAAVVEGQFDDAEEDEDDAIL
jgi:hypothetical protein